MPIYISDHKRAWTSANSISVSRRVYHCCSYRHRKQHGYYSNSGKITHKKKMSGVRHVKAPLKGRKWRYASQTLRLLGDWTPDIRGWRHKRAISKVVSGHYKPSLRDLRVRMRELFTSGPRRGRSQTRSGLGAVDTMGARSQHGLYFNLLFFSLSCTRQFSRLKSNCVLY